MVSSINNRSTDLINKLQKKSNDLLEKLASGKRINRASDDAAGLAIMADLEASVKSSQVAQRNISDGVSAVAIAEGAMGQLGDIEIRKQELAAQSANGTLSDDQRVALDQEYQALSQEADRIVATTEFNGRQLLEGSSIDVQAGTDGSENSTISIAIDGIATVAGADSIATREDALTAIESTGSRISSLAQARGKIGAAEARLNIAHRQQENQALNEEKAASTIRDVDVADVTAKLAATNIRANGAVALSAQANQTSKIVLDLLK